MRKERTSDCDKEKTRESDQRKDLALTTDPIAGVEDLPAAAIEATFS